MMDIEMFTEEKNGIFFFQTEDGRAFMSDDTDMEEV